MIPALVIYCIKEIEKRGLHEVGKALLKPCLLVVCMLTVQSFPLSDYSRLFPSNWVFYFKVKQSHSKAGQ